MYLSDLTQEEQSHWILHISAAKRDFAGQVAVINGLDALLVNSVQLPNVVHPCKLHSILDGEVVVNG